MRISQDCLTLEKITNDDIDTNGKLIHPIPNSVTNIGNHAFRGCTNLTNITIPNSVTNIGNWVFEYCTSLTGITIPNSVINIGFGAFEDCTSLTDITIPNSVTNIGNFAFYGCTSLTGVTIPNSVTNIGDFAFDDCTSLTNIVIASDDDDIIARIKALLPPELLDKVAPKEVYIRAKEIQTEALARVEAAIKIPQLDAHIPIQGIQSIIGGYADSNELGQARQEMQGIKIPATDTSEGWAAYKVAVKAIATRHVEAMKAEVGNKNSASASSSSSSLSSSSSSSRPSNSSSSDDDDIIARIKALLPPELLDKVAPKEVYIRAIAQSQLIAAYPVIAFAINHPYATSVTAGVLVALAVAATILTLGVAPALAAATGLTATAATYGTAATLGALAGTATFFSIPSNLSAHVAAQHQDDEQDELGVNAVPVAM